jgi:hypothetical protein
MRRCSLTHTDLEIIWGEGDYVNTNKFPGQVKNLQICMGDKMKH